MKSGDEIVSVELLKGDITALNPALDFCGCTGYIGLHLHAEVTKKLKGIKFKTSSLEHFFVTSDRRIVHTETELVDGIVLSSQPIRMRNTLWQRDDINDWLSNTDTVDTFKLYSLIHDKLRFYFEFVNDATYDVICIWAIGTYFFHLFTAYPYLFINGFKRTGKTKLLRFLQQISHNAFLSTSITTASLHRSIQSLRCTLLIDEHERFSTKKLNDRMQELRAALLGGHQQGSIALKVSGNENKVVETFETYSPKALANISGLDDVLEDRCIHVLMQRAIGDQKNTEISNADIEWQQIRNQLHRFYLENSTSISHITAKIPTIISSRERQLWIPIFTLAQFFEHAGVDGLVSRIEIFATDSSKVRTSDETAANEVIIIKTLLEMVKSEGYFPVSEIKEQFAKEFENSDWISSETIGRMLKRLGIQNKRRVGRGFEYLLTPELVATLAMRYGVLENATLPAFPTQHTPSASVCSEGSECSVAFSKEGEI